MAPAQIAILWANVECTLTDLRLAIFSKSWSATETLSSLMGLSGSKYESTLINFEYRMKLWWIGSQFGHLEDDILKSIMIKHDPKTTVRGPESSNRIFSRWPQ